jgi:hypothetical protein
MNLPEILERTACRIAPYAKAEHNNESIEVKIKKRGMKKLRSMKDSPGTAFECILGGDNGQLEIEVRVERKPFTCTPLTMELDNGRMKRISVLLVHYPATNTNNPVEGSDLVKLENGEKITYALSFKNSKGSVLLSYEPRYF